MPVMPFFGRAQRVREKKDILASYGDTEIPELSPWADSSDLERITYEDYLGLRPGIGSRDHAMRIAAIAKARNLICTTVARMPIVAMRGSDRVKRQPAWFKQLQPGIPNFHVLSGIVDHLFFYGRAWLLITDRGAKGEILATRFVPRAQAEEEGGQLIRAFGQPVTPEQTIRIDANTDGFLRTGRDIIIEAWEIERAAREAGACPVPALVLKQLEGRDLNSEEAEEFLKYFSSRRARRHGSVAFVNKAIDVQALGQQAENLLIDARNYAVLQIARATGLPAWALDGAVTAQGASLNYQNSASRNREIIDAITPYMLAIEATFSLFLPTGQEARFDTTDMLRADLAARYDAYEVAIRAGFLTVEEVRARENLPALPQHTPNLPQEPSDNSGAVR